MYAVTQFDITPPPAQVSKSLYDMVSKLPVTVCITSKNVETVKNGIIPLSRRIQSLHCYCMSCEELTGMCAGIGLMCYLKELIVTSCRLNGDAIMRLAEGLSTSGCRLEKLDLSNNRLRSVHSSQLEALVSHNNRSNNNFNSSNINDGNSNNNSNNSSAICDRVPGNVQNTQSGNTAAHEPNTSLSGLQHHNRLTTLCLSRCNIDCSLMTCLCNALAGGQLKYLDLQHNPLYYDGASVLSELISSTSSLTNINIMNCRLTQDQHRPYNSSGITSLAQSIGQHENLTTLDNVTKHQYIAI